MRNGTSEVHAQEKQENQDAKRAIKRKKQYITVDDIEVDARV